MRDIEIEAWVLRVAEQVGRGEHSEDSLVELKSRWPDKADKAARRIAAHANAALGESILWIIGIDETEGVCGADPKELADWFRQVQAQFNDVYPSLHDLNVRVGDKTVVALLFNTERAPFLVKNPAFSTPGGGPVELEIPWREGRRTRTATRQDLIRLLTPLIRLPELEFLACTLSVQEPDEKPNVYNSRQIRARTWQIQGEMYIIPHNSASVVIPFHRCSVTAVLSNGSIVDLSSSLRLTAPTSLGIDTARGGGPFQYRDSATVTATSSEAIVAGPGRLKLFATVEDPVEYDSAQGVVTIELRLHVVAASLPLVASQQLHPCDTQGGRRWSWDIGKG